MANLTSGAIAGLALSTLLVGLSYAQGFGAAAQAVVDNVKAGDLAGTVTALLNGPGVITGALLNGFEGGAGILSPPGTAGSIDVLLTLRQKSRRHWFRWPRTRYPARRPTRSP